MNMATRVTMISFLLQFMITYWFRCKACKGEGVIIQAKKRIGKMGKK